MPPADEIQRYMTGAWRMMMGREDGLELLDISSDGFWNSFFSIIVASPALIVTWVTYTNQISGVADDLSARFGTVILIGFANLSAWIIPIVVLAVTAGPLGIGDRFVHYVVASNWGTAIAAWLMLPPDILRMFGFDENGQTIGLMQFALFATVMVLAWRLVNVALQKGALAATLVYFGMGFASLFVYFMLLNLLGLMSTVAA